MKRKDPDAKALAHYEAEREANEALIDDALSYIVGPEKAAEHKRRRARIIPAPEWLKKRMLKSREDSKHVTLDEMLQQAKASEKYRRIEGFEPWVIEQLELCRAGKRPPISEAELHEQARLGAERIRRWEKERKSAQRRTHAG